MIIHPIFLEGTITSVRNNLQDSVDATALSGSEGVCLIRHREAIVNVDFGEHPRRPAEEQQPQQSPEYITHLIIIQ